MYCGFLESNRYVYARDYISTDGTVYCGNVQYTYSVNNTRKVNSEPKGFDVIDKLDVIESDGFKIIENKEYGEMQVATSESRVNPGKGSY